jgi:hypothetical protein
MAIYKNRLVQVMGPNIQANSPETINVRYKDGSNENVKLDEVSFTEDEQKTLQKNHPSKYDNVKLAQPSDIEAIEKGNPVSGKSVQEAKQDKPVADKPVTATPASTPSTTTVSPGAVNTPSV